MHKTKFLLTLMIIGITLLGCSSNTAPSTVEKQKHTKPEKVVSTVEPEGEEPEELEETEENDKGIIKSYLYNINLDRVKPKKSAEELNLFDLGELTREKVYNELAFCVEEVDKDNKVFYTLNEILENYTDTEDIFNLPVDKVALTSKLNDEHKLDNIKKDIISYNELGLDTVQFSTDTNAYSNYKAIENDHWQFKLTEYTIKLAGKQISNAQDVLSAIGRPDYFYQLNEADTLPYGSDDSMGYFIVLSYDYGDYVLSFVTSGDSKDPENGNTFKVVLTSKEMFDATYGWGGFLKEEVSREGWIKIEINSNTEQDEADKDENEYVEQ